MKSIKDVLREKGSEIVAIGPDASVFDAIELMAKRDIGAVVVKQGDKPIGLFSERDYARKLILVGRASKDTPVSEAMTQHVAYALPSQTVEECMALMTDKHVRHLLVMEQGALLGLVSLGDMVKAIIDEQQFIIEQLEHYISG